MPGLRARLHLKEQLERLDAAALTYPTFTFDSYSAGNVDANVATTDYYTANQIRPYILLDDTNLNPVNLPEYSAEATLPDGWTISPYTSLGYTGSRIIVPDGVYAVSWYWDCSYGDSTTWDNWIRMESIANDGTQYPTAPQSYVGGPWGAAAAVVKLVGPTNRISFQCTNRSGTDTGILLHTITITRLDA